MPTSNGTARADTPDHLSSSVDQHTESNTVEVPITVTYDPENRSHKLEVDRAVQGVEVSPHGDIHLYWRSLTSAKVKLNLSMATDGIEFYGLSAGFSGTDRPSEQAALPLDLAFPPDANGGRTRLVLAVHRSWLTHLPCAVDYSISLNGGQYRFDPKIYNEPGEQTTSRV